MYTDPNLLLTKRPPPMSPPMSQTWMEIWSLSSFCPSGKNSSRLAIMQMNAEGSRIRPTRRAHFPVQHMLLPFTFYLFSLISCSLSVPTLTLSVVCFPLSLSQKKVSERWAKQTKKGGAWEVRHPVTLRKSNTVTVTAGRREGTKAKYCCGCLQSDFRPVYLFRQKWKSSAGKKIYFSTHVKVKTQDKH